MRLQSKNPVFTRQDAFGGRTGPAGHAPSAEQLDQMYAAPAYQGTAARDRMTLDDVVVRTAMTLGTLILVAAATWVVADVPSYPILIGAALVGVGLGFFISLKHVTNPAVILGYAAVEGVFIGMASKAITLVVSNFVGQDLGPSMVMQAVLGTLGAAAAMLAVYKLKIIRVTPKFTKFVIGATIGFFVAIMLNFVLSLFGVGFGASGLGPIGLVFAVIGAALACFNLLLDFEYISQGIAHGAPEKDSWFAAFGLTVTLVWLYIEILRIIAALTIMNND